MGSNVGSLVGATLGFMMGITVSSMDDKWAGMPIPGIMMCLGMALGRFYAELDRRESESRVRVVKPPVVSQPIDKRNFQSLEDRKIVVLLPDLGLPDADWKVRIWHKVPGQFVEVGETLLEVSYNQIKSDIPSPVSGDLLTINKLVGSNVSTGAALATISRR